MNSILNRFDLLERPEALVDSSKSHEYTCLQLKKLIEEKFIKAEDIYQNTINFFKCHEMVAKFSPTLTYHMSVHFNLFAGSVLALGSDLQINKYVTQANNGVIGCFAITEHVAGVFSGMRLDTIAEYQKESNTFLLNGSKNWISLGLQAKYGVIIADLLFNKEKLGAHAFIVNLSLEGITRKPVLSKACLQGLDNAQIFFSDVIIPASSLLSKYTEIIEGKYIKKDPKYSFLTIANRLQSGRICIASAAIALTQNEINKCTNYARKKEIAIDKTNTIRMIDLPRIKESFTKFNNEIRQINNYKEKVQILYSKELENPSKNLLNSIAILKMYSTYRCCDILHQSRILIGSYGLSQESNLISSHDALYSLLVVEGDNTLLAQKIVKDYLKKIYQNKSRLIYLFFELLSGKFKKIYYTIYILVLITFASNKLKSWIGLNQYIHSLAMLLAEEDINS